MQKCLLQNTYQNVQALASDFVFLAQPIFCSVSFLLSLLLFILLSLSLSFSLSLSLLSSQIQSLSPSLFPSSTHSFVPYSFLPLSLKLFFIVSLPLSLPICSHIELEFQSEGWWQRPHTRLRCRQCKCSLVENPNLRSIKCHGCKKQMETRSSFVFWYL